MSHIIIKAADYSKRFFLSEMFFFPDFGWALNFLSEKKLPHYLRQPQQ